MRAPIMALAVASLAVSQAACTGPGMGCGLTEQTYAQLHVGQSVSDVEQLVGCKGSTLINSSSAVGHLLMVRYAGPSGEQTTLWFNNGQLNNFQRGPALGVRVRY